MAVQASAKQQNLVANGPSDLRRVDGAEAHRWRWLTDTAPFSALDDGARSARFVVEQISDKDFRIPQGFGFRYNPDGEDLALPVVALPAVAPLVGYWASWLLERGVQAARARLKANLAKKLPTPIPYQGR